MKSLSITFILLVAGQLCFAQNNQKSDSLMLALTNATSDTARVLIYEKLMNTESDDKKRIEFGLQGFYLAKNIHYNKGIILCGNKVGLKLINDDEHFKAIPILMETKQVAERTNDKNGLATALGTLGYAYGKFDFEKSLYYYFACKNLMKKEGISEDIFPVSLGIGLRYKDDNKNLDSALFYLNKSYQLALNSNAYSHRPIEHLTHFGQIYYNKGQKDIALDYFRKAIAAQSTGKDWTNRYIAYIFRDRNQLDSAIFFAQKSFNSETKEYHSFETANLLFELYRKSNPAKALEYLIIATTANDRRFNQDKIQQVNKLAFDDQERKATLKRNIEAAKIESQNRLRMNAFLGITFTLLVIAFFLYRNNRLKQKAKQTIEKAYDQLKSTQSQLIQSEKMASLGELTAGIAHEIQNPLNFVNNFSEVSNELIAEVEEERAKNPESRDENLVSKILSDIKQNLEKINHHGKRADAIVKGMLQHSRTRSGVIEPTDINALADEYLRLSYHGMRAKDKSFNATMVTDFDETLPNINVIPQDIGRVLLNLINNAFYAAPLPPEGGFKDPNYIHNPTVTVRTSFIPPSGGTRGAVISVSDNGPGIPSHIIDKIFQPFFTTKPTGQGTGLGLSLAYDIVKAHGGELKVETKEGEGSEFIILLPA